MPPQCTSPLPHCKETLPDPARGRTIRFIVARKGSGGFLIAILVGIIGGAAIGGTWPAIGLELAFLGELFLNALFMIVVPLVICSLIVGITGLGDIRKLGGIGGKTILYYMVTTAFSVIIGIILVNIVKPGHADTPEAQLKLRGGVEMREGRYTIDKNTVTLISKKFKSFDQHYLLKLTDQNIRGNFDGEQKGGKTLKVNKWTNEEGESATPRKQGKGILIDLAVADKVKGKDKTIVEVLKDVLLGLVPKNLFDAMAKTQVLPLIVFSLLFGAVLTTLGPRGRPVIAFFEGTNEAIMGVVRILMLFAPIGIGALIAGRLGKAGGFAEFGEELTRLAWYAGTVIVGLLIHAVVVLPLILRLFGRRKVLPFAGNTLPALVTAFSTASSSATLPTTMRCATERNKVPSRTSSFVLPLGATINMDGTAMYEAVAAIFIAQMYGMELTVVHMVIIFLTATLAAVGAAGIPEAGLVTMVIVLTAVGIPLAGISLILVIDWFLDRCRTTVNVWGDSIGAAVIDQMATEKS